MVSTSSDLELSLDPVEPWLDGLPAWMVLEVVNTGSDRTYPSLPPACVLAAATGIGLRLGPEPRPLAQVRPLDPHELHGMAPGYVLGPGQSRRMLMDLAVPLGSLPPGHHTLHVDYGDGLAQVEREVGIDALDPAERDAVASLRMEDGWLDRWVCSARPSPLAWASLPGRVRTGLRLHAALGALATAEHLETLPPDLFTGLPLELEPEATVLEYEVVRAMGQPGADRQRAHIAERWPGLVWRLDQIERGQGLLVLLREMAEIGRAGGSSLDDDGEPAM